MAGRKSAIPIGAGVRLPSGALARRVNGHTVAGHIQVIELTHDGKDAGKRKLTPIGDCHYVARDWKSAVAGAQAERAGTTQNVQKDPT